MVHRALSSLGQFVQFKAPLNIPATFVVAVGLLTQYAASTLAQTAVGPTGQALQATPQAAPGSALVNVQRLPPSLDANQRREALVGKWFGETQTTEGRKLRWLTERDANGTYRTQYYMARSEPQLGGSNLSNQSFEERVELGQWGVSGEIGRAHV